MEIMAVDLGAELRERIEPSLFGPPVVGSTPVLSQFPCVIERNALCPPDAGNLVGPASGVKSPMQVLELLMRDFDAEGTDLCGHQNDPKSNLGRIES